MEEPTCQNFDYLDEKNVPYVCYGPWVGILCAKFGGVITFAVKVWSWKLCQIKFLSIVE